MINTLTVSIIIPMYNASSTITRCLESVMSQTYKNIEIIIIDDGSKDNSLQVCSQLIQNDPRIQLISTANSGVSIARNRGILAASGYYCTFVDSDDWIEPTHIEQLVKKINNIDCVISSYTMENNGQFNYHQLSECIYTYSSVLTPPVISMFKNGYIHPCWNKLFKLDIIKKMHISFPSHIQISEDSIFCIEYLKHCTSICTTASTTYHYCKSNLSTSLSSKVYPDIFSTYEIVYTKLQSLLMQMTSDTHVIDRTLTQTIFPQLYGSIFKIVNDNTKTYLQKKAIFNSLFILPYSKKTLYDALISSDSVKERIIIKLIIAKQFGIIMILNKWILHHHR